MQVGLNFDLNTFISFKTWSKCAYGQIATRNGFLHSRKYWIGVFLSLEISFLFLLSTALSGQLLDDQYKRCNANFY